MEERCVFCQIAGKAIICENDLAKAFYDIFPVNEGHTWWCYTCRYPF